MFLLSVKGRRVHSVAEPFTVTGDNLSDTLGFRFMDGVPDGNVYLKTESGTITDRIKLTRDINSEYIYTWMPGRANLPRSGRIFCQLSVEKAIPNDPNNDVTVWQSYVFELTIDRAIDADTPIVAAYATTLQQWEAAMAGYAETVEGGGLQFNIDGDRVGLKRLSDESYTYTEHLTGAAGKQVEFNLTSTHLQWRYVGDAVWIDLLALSTLTQQIIEDTLAAAQAARDAAEAAQTGAEAARDIAVTAKTDAQTAKDAAVTAKNDAVTAKTVAQTAQTAAETAKAGAETAQTGAASSASDAETYAAAAAQSAIEAALSAGGGVTSFKGRSGAVNPAEGDYTPTMVGAEPAFTDASGKTAAFTQAASRVAIATGETLAILFGKIMKWLADLGTLAFKSTVAKTDLESSVQTSLGKADSALQSFTETDPTVPSWAKASIKPTYTAAEVGAATSGHNHSGTYALATHASQHASGGGDAITPAAIGAAASGHTHTGTYAPATHATQHASGGADAVTPAAIGAVASSAVGAASGVASLDADTKVTAAQASAAIVTVTASITIGSTHYGRMLYCSNASAITITIPTGIPVGAEIEIYRAGAGTVTLAASGVTIQCKETAYGIADQYTSVVLKVVASNVVAIQGNVG